MLRSARGEPRLDAAVVSCGRRRRLPPPRPPSARSCACAFGRACSASRGRRLHQPGVAEELGDPVRRLGADLEPMRDALPSSVMRSACAAVEQRVVGAELLDEAAVARAARIGDHDVNRTGASWRRRGSGGFSTFCTSLQIFSRGKPGGGQSCRARPCASVPSGRASSSFSSSRPCRHAASGAC